MSNTTPRLWNSDGETFELNVGHDPCNDSLCGDCHHSLPIKEVFELSQTLDPKVWSIITDAEGDFVALVLTEMAQELVDRINGHAIIRSSL